MAATSVRSTPVLLQAASRSEIRRPIAVVAAAPATPTPVAPPPEAPLTEPWEALAGCESTGNWSIDTGNGFYGGIQIQESTWIAYGGQQYAAYPNQATQAEQIDVGVNILHGQGPTAWPVCGPRVGLH